VKLFKDSNRDIANVPHSGQAKTAATACNEQKTDMFSTEDQRMMGGSQFPLGLIHPSAYGGILQLDSGPYASYSVLCQFPQ
jgi:hypothetical protein